MLLGRILTLRCYRSWAREPSEESRLGMERGPGTCLWGRPSSALLPRPCGLWNCYCLETPGASPRQEPSPLPRSPSTLAAPGREGGPDLKLLPVDGLLERVLPADSFPLGGGQPPWRQLLRPGSRGRPPASSQRPARLGGAARGPDGARSARPARPPGSRSPGSVRAL